MNIALIGFMGTGKTTVGTLLAQELNMEFIDVDTCIVQETGMTIAEIFEKKGEPYFRDMETVVLKRYAHSDNIVLSCGGGIILRDENRRILSENFFVIHLSASVDTIVRRLKDEAATRPLLQGNDLRTRVEKLLKTRQKLYEEVREMEIATDGKTPQEIVRSIIRELYDGDT